MLLLHLWKFNTDTEVGLPCVEQTLVPVWIALTLRSTRYLSQVPIFTVVIG